jgi:hypothetical protein
MSQRRSQVFTATLKSDDRFDYTQWRQHGLPKTSLKQLALLGKQSDPTDRPPLELHEDLVEVLSGNSPSTPERL